jgi:hypothetical protein
MRRMKKFFIVSYNDLIENANYVEDKINNFLDNHKIESVKMHRLTALIIVITYEDKK